LSKPFWLIAANYRSSAFSMKLSSGIDMDSSSSIF